METHAKDMIETLLSLENQIEAARAELEEAKQLKADAEKNANIKIAQFGLRELLLPEMLGGRTALRVEATHYETVQRAQDKKISNLNETIINCNGRIQNAIAHYLSETQDPKFLYIKGLLDQTREVRHSAKSYEALVSLVSAQGDGTTPGPVLKDQHIEAIHHFGLLKDLGPNPLEKPFGLVKYSTPKFRKITEDYAAFLAQARRWPYEFSLSEHTSFALNFLEAPGPVRLEATAMSIDNPTDKLKLVRELERKAKEIVASYNTHHDRAVSALHTYFDDVRRNFI